MAGFIRILGPRQGKASVPSGGCSIRSISTRLDPGGTTSLPSQPTARGAGIVEDAQV